MIPKVCAGPKNGGSAFGATRYILGYTEAPPDHAAQRSGVYHQILEESLAREDRGVGTLWHPEAGDGIRPSAVYARNVASFATGDLEMEALFQASGKSNSPVEHLIFSVDTHATAALDDAHIMNASLKVIDKAGYENCPMVLSVHRDTDNLHVHAVVGTIDRTTMRPVPRSEIKSRLHEHTRETEVSLRKNGVELGNDHGLYVVRDLGLPTERIEKAAPDELRAWRIERQAKRAQRQSAAAPMLPRDHSAGDSLETRRNNMDTSDGHMHRTTDKALDRSHHGDAAPGSASNHGEAERSDFEKDAIQLKNSLGQDYVVQRPDSAYTNDQPAAEEWRQRLRDQASTITAEPQAKEQSQQRKPSLRL